LSRFFAEDRVDWSNEESMIGHLVRYSCLLAGDQRPCDQAALRDLVVSDFERANNAASLQNHELISDDDDRSHPPLSSITMPTLVIHGTADPLFPLAHGEALAAEIPGATLLVLDRAGHGVDPADWQIIVPAIVAHTMTGLSRT
jgi:pimeloyl-ACP methyl ester carboxylesterase